MSSIPLRERVVDVLARFISRRAGWVVMGTLLFVGFFSFFLPQVTPRNDSDDFVVDRDAATVFHKKFKKIFDKSDFFVIAYRQENLFTEHHLHELKDITNSLSDLENVRDVVSLSNVSDMRGTEDTFEVDDFLREIPSDPEALEALRERALGNPLYQRTLISDDDKTTAIIVFTSFPPDGSYDIDQVNQALLDGVNERLAPYREKGIRFAVAGWPVTTYFLGKYMKADAAKFFPITMVFTLGIIWFIFRNGRLFLLAGLGVLATLMATLGLAGLAKIPLNNASIAVVPLVMALALSDIVHTFTHLDRRRLIQSGGRPREALGHVLRAILFPCLLTSINTGIGFYSFTFNSVPAIRSFGWLAASGMIFEFIVSFGLVAPLLVYMRSDRIYHDPDLHVKREVPRFLRWVHKWVLRRPWGSLLVCLGGLAWAGWSARDLRVDTNLENLFSVTSPLRQDINHVRENLAGMEPIDIAFHAGRDAFKDPVLLAQLEEIEQELKKDPRIHAVSGFGDYLKEMNKAMHAENQAEFRLPTSRRLIEQYLLLYGRDDLENFVSPGFDWTRFMIRAHAPGSTESRDLINDIQVILDRHPLPGVHSTITGSVALAVRTMKVMVTDQMQNIGSTVFVIWMVMVVVLRSWGLALLFLLPNLFPIAMNFGIMGFFGIPLDTGTSLIAASAFGIIVDDTVHFFVAYGARRKKGLSVAQSLEETAFEKGEASVSSFVIIGGAFGVLTVSHFQPILFFGVLNLVILVVGMVGDQVFLKSVLTLWGRWKDRAPKKIIPQER
jgi:predicted RND superfamily exporter protein